MNHFLRRLRTYDSSFPPDSSNFQFPISNFSVDFVARHPPPQQRLLSLLDSSSP